MKKILVSYRLKAERSAEEYEEYFRSEKYAVVTGFPSVKEFRLYRVGELLEGKKDADFIGELVVSSLEDYEKDRNTDDFRKFIEKWIEFAIPESMRVIALDEVQP